VYVGHCLVQFANAVEPDMVGDVVTG